MITLYGIKNCDTVKKAQKWLTLQNIDFQFHDFRKDGLEKKLVQQWIRTVGWETLVNKRSTTWKGLDDVTKSNLNDKTVIDIILEQPTLIKRPVLTLKDQLLIGFKEAEYLAITK